MGYNYTRINRPRNRKLYIYLPNSYNEKPDEYYPVLYMFDGQNVFLIAMPLMENHGD